MKSFREHIESFKAQNDLVADTRGLSTVEYVILLVLIAVMAVGTWHSFGSMVVGKLTSASSSYASSVVPTQ